MPSIFVLDDDPTILALLGELLRDEGHQVTSSALWSEVAMPLVRRDVAAGDEPTLLICDLHMPGINGVDFARIVRRHRPSIRIILYTSSSPRSFDLPPGLVDEVVFKQGGPDLLLAAVRRMVATTPRS